MTHWQDDDDVHETYILPIDDDFYVFVDDVHVDVNDDGRRHSYGAPQEIFYLFGCVVARFLLAHAHAHAQGLVHVLVWEIKK